MGNGNYACWRERAVDAHLNAALHNPAIADSYNEQPPAWDGAENGGSGKAPLRVWFANVDHLYFVL